MVRLILLLSSLSSLALAFHDGAPNAACMTMTPSHGSSKPRPGSGFYTIMTEKLQDGSGIRGLLTTSGPDMFEGFMIQAWQMDNSNVVGSFVSSATPDGLAKPLTCFRSENDTLTHNGGGCSGSGESG